MSLVYDRKLLRFVAREVVAGASYVAGDNITIVDNVISAGGGGDTLSSEGVLIASATEKTTPVDADMFGLMDSAASNVLKRLSFVNLKAALKNYFDTTYSNVVGIGRGYYGGGNKGGSYSSDIDGLVFITEVAINPSAALVSSRVALYSGSSITNGYFLSGVNASAVYQTEIDGITFSSEAAINPAASATAKSSGTSVSSSLAVYTCGGAISGNNHLTSIDRLTFNTESFTPIATALVTGTYNCGGIYSVNNGYVCGGSPFNNPINEIQGIRYSIVDPEIQTVV